MACLPVDGGSRGGGGGGGIGLMRCGVRGEDHFSPQV